MPQVINTNIASLNAQRNLNTSSADLNVSLQRLSSGLRINSAKDDAAGLSIATRFTSRIQGLTIAQRNANDAISLAQTSEGALQEVTKILQRSRELALQSANGSNSAQDRKALQAEVNQLKQELTRISTTTSFNGLKVLDGTLTNASFQIGAEANQTVNVSIQDTRTTALGSNTVKTNNNDGIEQATHRLFVGGGTSTDAAGVGTDAGAASDANGVQNGYAATTFSVTNITSAGATNTDSSVTTTVNDDAATIASNLSGVTGVTATAFNEVVLTNYASSDANGEVAITVSGSGVDISLDVLSGAETYSDAATAINANTNFSNAGVYAKATASSLTIYATGGQDFAVTAVSDATIDGLSGFKTGDTASSVDSDSTSAAFGGRLDIQLDAGYTIAASDNGLLGGTANVAVTSTGAGLAGITGGNNVVAQTVTLSGSTGSTTVSISADEEASAIATKINNVSGTTNIAASATTEVQLSNLSADGTVTFSLYGDNTNSNPAAISAAVTTSDFTALVKAINDVAGNTGVTAEFNGANNVIKLTHSSGKDVRLENFTHSASVNYQAPTSDAPVSGDGSSVVDAVTGSINVVGNPNGNSGTTVTLYDGGIRDGFDSTVIGGEVKFTSDSSFSVSSNISGVGYNGSLFGVDASAGNSSSSSTVNQIDISTAAGAQDAIDVLDQAINQVSSVRADLGAVQSRFESAIRNLSNNVENLNIARSRILDTDFAAETAALTKNQILQQAGISVLSQANQLPQNVLALLQ